MSNVRPFDAAARPDTARPHRRRAEDVPPPGRRSGRGANSVLPYLAHTIATSPNAGPPGGMERRSRRANVSVAAQLARGAQDADLAPGLKIRPMAQPTSEMAFEAWKQADARARDYEARLAQAWKAYDQLGAPSPDAQLVAEVALFREVAQRRLSELLQVMKASNAGPDLLLGPGGEARAA